MIAVGLVLLAGALWCMARASSTEGWPWPWETSATTDCAYYFDGGSVGWDDRQDWPDMSERKNVTFGRRSGLLVL